MGKLSKVTEIEEGNESEVKEIKGYRYDVISKGQLKKESFRKNKMDGLSGDVDKIAEEGIAASQGGGEIYVAIYNKKIVKLYIFEVTEVEGVGKVFQLKNEYKSEDLLTDDVEAAFEKDIKDEMIPKADTYDRVIFKDTVINKGDYKTKYSYMGMILGFVIGYLLFGIPMNNYAMGIGLGFCFAVCYGLIFAKHEKVNPDASDVEEEEESKEEEDIEE